MNRTKRKNPEYPCLPRLWRGSSLPRGIEKYSTGAVKKKDLYDRYSR